MTYEPTNSYEEPEKNLGRHIDQHSFFVAKGQALLTFLGRLKAPEILDVGVGSGMFSMLLLAQGACQNAVSVDPYYPEETQEFFRKTDSFQEEAACQIVQTRIDDECFRTC